MTRKERVQGFLVAARTIQVIDRQGVMSVLDAVGLALLEMKGEKVDVNPCYAAFTKAFAADKLPLELGDYLQMNSERTLVWLPEDLIEVNQVEAIIDKYQAQLIFQQQRWIARQVQNRLLPQKAAYALRRLLERFQNGQLSFNQLQTASLQVVLNLQAPRLLKYFQNLQTQQRIHDKAMVAQVSQICPAAQLLQKVSQVKRLHRGSQHVQIDLIRPPQDLMARFWRLEVLLAVMKKRHLPVLTPASLPPDLRALNVDWQAILAPWNQSEN